MPDDFDGDGLRLPRPRLNAAQAQAPIRLLSLTGGGYRGLFTAQVLVQLCAQARHAGPLHKTFHVFAGTSIGGLMACALAVGVPPQRVVDAIDAYGPAIFPSRRGAKLRRVVFGALYDADNLCRAIDAALGPHAKTRLEDIDVGLIVPAVDWNSGTTRIFQSGAMGKRHAGDTLLRDVCLATSAAPTYFKPHEVDGAAMLDGGLVANNPDTIAMLEVVRRWPDALKRLQMLSIGTAGAVAQRPGAQADKSGAGWAPELPIFMMDVQEQTAAAQSARVLGARYLRINHVPAPGQEAFARLDLANDQARRLLLQAATAAAQAAYGSHRAFVDRILSGA